MAKDWWKILVPKICIKNVSVAKFPGVMSCLYFLLNSALLEKTKKNLVIYIFILNFCFRCHIFKQGFLQLHTKSYVRTFGSGEMSSSNYKKNILEKRHFLFLLPVYILMERTVVFPNCKHNGEVHFFWPLKNKEMILLNQFYFLDNCPFKSWNAI